MDFPANSNKVTTQKAPKAPVEKKIEKITTGEVIQRKRSLGDRFKSVFLGADLNSVVRYIAGDVLLPALKNMVVDSIEMGAKRAIYGDSSSSRRRAPESGRPRVSYNSPIDRGYSRSAGPSTMLPRQPPHYTDSRRRQTVGDIVLSSRAEAENVLSMMKNVIDQYDTCSIADLYEMVGLPSGFIDHNWGWSDLLYIDVRQTREGYVIDLPAAEPL